MNENSNSLITRIMQFRYFLIIKQSFKTAKTSIYEDIFFSKPNSTVKPGPKAKAGKVEF